MSRTEDDFSMNQKFFKLCLQDYIFRSYHFLGEVTFKIMFVVANIMFSNFHSFVFFVIRRFFSVGLFCFNIALQSQK